MSCSSLKQCTSIQQYRTSEVSGKEQEREKRYGAQAEREKREMAEQNRLPQSEPACQRPFAPSSLHSMLATGLSPLRTPLLILRGRPSPFCISRKAGTRSISRKLHVAIVGSGPAGFYAADELFRSSLKDVKVDMYEKLPTPYGLVRSGVAPDHPEVKAVEAVFHALAQYPNFNFVGNVQVGKHITIDELKEAYQIIILAYGAEDYRKLGIPGEDLQGVHSARYECFNISSTAYSLHFLAHLSSMKSAFPCPRDGLGFHALFILTSPNVSLMTETDHL